MNSGCRAAMENLRWMVNENQALNRVKMQNLVVIKSGFVCLGAMQQLKNRAHASRFFDEVLGYVDDLEAYRLRYENAGKFDLEESFTCSVGVYVRIRNFLEGK